MASNFDDRSSIRRYLLNQLTDDAQQQIEQRLLTDDELFDQIQATEDELIDEYLTGALSKDEAEMFEKHFLVTAERQQKLRFAKAFRRYVATHASGQPQKTSDKARASWTWRSFVSGSPLRAAAFAALILVAALGVWRIFFYQSDVDKGLIALNSAYRDQRPVEARITQFKYAPFVITRGPGMANVNESELRRAELTLLDAVRDHPGAVSHHALGKFYLMNKQFDKAIAQFEESLKADPRNAQIYADLGAACLERGKHELERGKSDQANSEAGKGLEDLGRGLENLNKALELNPNLLEALFNRALCHQYQALPGQAEADWRAYLEKDSNSQWAVEARQNLKLLEDNKISVSQNAGSSLDIFMRAYRAGDDDAAWEVYRRNHAAAGNSITRGLLDAILKDNASRETTDVLGALTYLSELETRRVGDTYTSDVAKVYASATPRTRMILAEARLDVAKGYELFTQSKISDAIEFFSRARNAFDKVGDDPETLSAAGAIAHGAAVQPDLELGLQILGRIIPVCESKGRKWLLAQMLTERAHIQSNLNNYSEAITDGNRALSLFQELGDLSGTLNSFVQIASLHLFLNDSERSLSFLERALAIAQLEGASPSQIWGIYIAVSLNLSALNLYRSALDYQSEALQLALTSRSPLYISRSYQYIGLSYGYLRRFDQAIENVRYAYEQGRPLAKERNGQNMMASASLKLGDLYRASGDQPKALEAYDESTRLYEALGFAHYSYAAHKGKFLSYLAENNEAMASQELPIVLNLFEGYREKIQEERQKSFFFDREQDTYDLAIDFTYSKNGDQRRAFEYSEISRARGLHDLMRNGAEVTQGDSGLDLRTSQVARTGVARSRTVSEIQQELPEKVQIVQYAVLEKKLIIWLVTKSDITAEPVEVESTKLTDLVETTIKQINERDDTGAAGGLKNLYDLLIKPFEARLDRNKLLCFVPDKVLHYVPFDALVSSSSGRYLVEDYRLMVSPSATVFIDCTNEGSRSRGVGKEERLLAVGNPAFDRDANPNLTNLPSAEREAEDIASYYPLHRVLLRDQATVRSVKNELTYADVAHFAAHYEIDAWSKLSSRLLLAKALERAHSEPANGDLASSEVYGMHLARTKLVVLSACQTGIEQQFGGEGAIGFARPFLVAGVPVVVASLWPVNSDATSELMIAFHRFRRLGHLSASEALMRAQQEMLAVGNSRYSNPYYWAGFTTIGGYADF